MGLFGSTPEELDEEYERGREDEKNADFINHITHDIADMTPGPTSEEWEAYDEGWHDEKGDTGCYITTACTHYRGLPDDCRELAKLRKFRDSYVLRTPEGRKLVEEYYSKAPRIVAAIDVSPRRREIYGNIFRDVVSRSMGLIEAGRHQEAMKNYIGEVRKLEAEFLAA